MKTTHAVWERENLGVDAYEIALDASDTPDMLRQEEARIIAAAEKWLQGHPDDMQPRFDVIEVYGEEGAPVPLRINHLENAFGG